MIDLHSHILPRVDDGPEDMEVALAGIGRLASQGVTHIVATSHFDGSLTASPSACRNRLELFQTALTLIESQSGALPPGVRISRGAEISLDVPHVNLSEPALRLAGTKYFLVEFSGFAAPPNALKALTDVISEGWIPVLAHPERYRMETHSPPAKAFVDIGVLLQVNAGSFVGQYGRHAQRVAWDLASDGLISIIASDYHCRGKPAINDCRKEFSAIGARDAFLILTQENPLNLLADQPPTSVPPVSRTALMRARQFFSGRF